MQVPGRDRLCGRCGGWVEPGGYDAGYAFKKVMIDFCGRSPTLHGKDQFAAEKDSQAALHAVLDVCLDSEYWRGQGGRVWNLANSKIGPLRAIKAGPDAGPIPLANYDDDYAFFVFTQTDGRDAREVLTGQTFVTARRVDGQTIYEEWDRTPDEDIDERGQDLYQGVAKERRAGLLTHRWFLMINTMFTSVPRTTAAQAYRAFLGYDLSRLEGLSPVPGEPVDYDGKGVQAEDCAVCHSTLDPLTYPFSRYEGIGGGYGDSYSYAPDRLAGFTDVDGDLVVETPEKGVIFGQEVSDLVEWAAVAANSEAFRRATVSDYWEMVLGEPHGPMSRPSSANWWLVSSEHDHRIEKMLHDLTRRRPTVRLESCVLALSAVLLVSCKDAEQPNKSTKARVLAKPGPVWGATSPMPWVCRNGNCARNSVHMTASRMPIASPSAESTTLGIDQPLADAPVGAPIAVDRVAVAACGERLAKDKAGPAILFGPVWRRSARARREVAQNLVRRILARHPNETEVSGLVALYDTIAPLTDDPTREWSIGACMAATSAEASTEPAMTSRRDFIRGLAAFTGASAGASSCCPTGRLRPGPPIRVSSSSSASGGGSIIDGPLAIRASECATPTTINCFPDARVTSWDGSPFRAVALSGDDIGPIPAGFETDPSEILGRRRKDLMVATWNRTSVNHQIGQRRSVTGNEAWRGRTLQEMVAWQYGQDFAIPKST